jgi:hypothetical protein
LWEGFFIPKKCYSLHIKSYLPLCHVKPKTSPYNQRNYGVVIKIMLCFYFKVLC